MNITIDSRRCGGGKTTDPLNGIYSRIRNLIATDRVLVVVPSISLQNQYANDLSELNPFVINSANGEGSTVTRVFECFRNPFHSLVIITHATFILMPQNGYRNGWHLIIDEALEEVIRIQSIAATDNGVWSPNFDLNSVFDWSDEGESEYYSVDNHDDSRWCHLKLVRTPQKSILDNSETWRNLTNANYDLWMTARSWTTLGDQSGGMVKAIQTLDIGVLGGYQSVHIAAAAFQYTAMANWMNANGVSYSVLNEFVPQVIRGRLHAITGMKWSKAKLNGQPEILSAFQAYVAANSTGEVIALRNSGVTNSSYKEAVSSKYGAIKHNSYGINSDEWMTSTAVSLETALVPDTLLSGFIRDHWLDGSRSEKDTAICHLFAAYRFHQAIYRSTIRTSTPLPVDIFAVDELVGVCLTDYFVFSDKNPVVEIPITWESEKKSGRPMKYMSEEERKQANRDKVRKFRAKNKKDM